MNKVNFKICFHTSQQVMLRVTYIVLMFLGAFLYEMTVNVCLLLLIVGMLTEIYFISTMQKYILFKKFGRFKLIAFFHTGVIMIVDVVFLIKTKVY